MAIYVKGDAVANATSYELLEKTAEGAYTSLAEKNEINFALEDLQLAAGDHTLVVKAKADGYEDSDYSNELVYSVKDNRVDYTSDPGNWAQQTISSAGVVSTDVTQSNIMAVSNFEESIVITALTAERLLVAQVTYNADGSFKARSSWTTIGVGQANEYVTYSDDNPFNVVVATQASNTTYSVSEMLNLMDVRSAG